MTMSFRVYIAMSLDGYIATSDGGVGWLDPFLDEDYGYGQFIHEISHAIMGRVTYDHVRSVGEWPYPDLGVHILTSGRLDDAPEHVERWSETPLELVRSLDASGSDGDCWLIGGGRTIGAFEELDVIDQYEIFVMPVVLGGGVPLFAAPYPPRTLQLLSVKAWDNGVVRLLYVRPSEEAD